MRLRLDGERIPRALFSQRWAGRRASPMMGLNWAVAKGARRAGREPLRSQRDWLFFLAFVSKSSHVSVGIG